MITDKQRWQLYISFQAVAVTMEYILKMRPKCYKCSECIHHSKNSVMIFIGGPAGYVIIKSIRSILQYKVIWV